MDAEIGYPPCTADAVMELPCEGAKEMILVDDVDNGEFLCKLVKCMWEELLDKKKKRKC